MRTIILFILSSFLFTSGYALAQTCPCDTLELSNGFTGNEIIEALCPGGEAGNETITIVNEDNIIIESFSIGLGYAVQNVPPDVVCVIGGEGVKAVGNELSPQEYENCRVRLLSACGLESRPIPTLSEWGMIAMAGVLGMIGLFVAARRRKAAA